MKEEMLFMANSKHTPIVNEVFADNGEHSHWELIDSTNGRILWTESDATPSSPIDVEKDFEQDGKDIIEENKIAKWLEEQSKGMAVGERYTYPDVVSLIFNYYKSASPTSLTDMEDVVELAKEHENICKSVKDCKYHFIKGYKAGLAQSCITK